MSRRSLWQLLAPLLARQRRDLLIVLLLLPLAALAAMLVPYLTKVAIDDYIVPAQQAGTLAGVYGPLLELVGLGLGLVVIGYFAEAGYVVMVQRVGQRLIHDLRGVVYRHTLRLPRRYFDDHPIGAVLTRVTSDMEALGEGLASGVLTLFLECLKALAFLVMMFVLDWRLTLVLLLTFPVVGLLIGFFQSRVRRSFFAARQALAVATGYLQEALNGIKTVQLYNAEQQVIARFRDKNTRYYHAQNVSNLYDALLFSLVEGVSTLALALLLWYAGGALLAGTLTLGVLVAFMEYSQRLFTPIRELAQQLAVLQRSLAALEHIHEVCEAESDPAETAQTAKPVVTAPFRRLVFDNVHFRYRAHENDVLNGVSFTLERGQTLALVGATGSGKSTVIRLLTRAYGGHRGAIRLNDVDINTIPAPDLSHLIATVPQQAFLYHGTVAFNIGLNRPGLSRERIEQAARYVNAHAFIERLPGGFDALIQQGGANLSAGQAQLLALARAVAVDSELIILDEATSSVDSLTEQLIQEAVERIYRDKTVIAIAHRLSTIRHADTILVLDRGQIVEAGSHAELLERGGAYAELVGRLECAMP